MELSKAIELINPGLTPGVDAIWADLGNRTGMYGARMRRVQS